MKQFGIVVIALFAGITLISAQSEDQTHTLKSQDFKEIFQLAFDLPELQQYYQSDSNPGRKQVILKEFGQADHNNLLGVEKFGRQVEILTEDIIKEQGVKNYFVLGHWVCGTNSVSMQLEYVSEGILLSYRFEKIKDQWKLMNHSLIEEDR